MSKLSGELAVLAMDKAINTEGEVVMIILVKKTFADVVFFLQGLTYLTAGKIISTMTTFNVKTCRLTRWI